MEKKSRDANERGGFFQTAATTGRTDGLGRGRHEKLGSREGLYAVEIELIRLEQLDAGAPLDGGELNRDGVQGVPGKSGRNVGGARSGGRSGGDVKLARRDERMETRSAIRLGAHHMLARRRVSLVSIVSMSA